MGFVDKAKNAAEEAAGKVKEAVGNVTGDEDTKAEGQTDHTKADLKQTGEDVKDVFEG